MWRAAVSAVMALPTAFSTLADIGFEVRVVELRIMPHQPTFDTANVTFHALAFRLAVL